MTSTNLNDLADTLEAGTPCWTTNAAPGMKVGTPVVLVKKCTRAYGETALVRLENGLERGITSLSLNPMLPEEVPAWMTATSE
jgi:hypothetical protein